MRLEVPLKRKLEKYCNSDYYVVVPNSNLYYTSSSNYYAPSMYSTTTTFSTLTSTFTNTLTYGTI